MNFYTFRYSSFYLNIFNWERGTDHEEGHAFECEAENLIKAFLKFKDKVLDSLGKGKEANVYEWLPWSHQSQKPETLEKAKEVFKKYNLEDVI